MLSSPRLSRRPSWWQAARPIHLQVVNRLVAHATKAVCGFEMTPSLVRQSGSANIADLSDHTVCCAMGWSPGTAVDLAYANREIIAASE